MHAGAVPVNEPRAIKESFREPEKMNAACPDIYKKYFVNNANERIGLFAVLTDTFGIESGLYPGSFVHITPSLHIPHMVYVDMDKRCESFFNSKKTKEFVEKNKRYKQQSTFKFYQHDFTQKLEHKVASVDLLISLYAGFISRYCGRYLKKGGVLLANNSHGDAPLALLDKRFECIGVVNRDNDIFSYSEEALDTYFIPRAKKTLDKETIEKTMKGPEYIKAAYAYVFRKK